MWVDGVGGGLYSPSGDIQVHSARADKGSVESWASLPEEGVLKGA